MLSSAPELINAELTQGGPWLDDLAERYAIGVPDAWLGHLSDHPGLSMQVVPDPREAQVTAEEQVDPIGDDVHSPVPGLVHRYPDRVLLKVVSVCALYCRFCFRRERIGPGAGAMSPAALDRAIAYIAETPSIWEVILSGGDPLMLPAEKLRALFARLEAIPHVKVVRLHSRIPMVAPEKVTGDLINALTDADLTTVLAVHTNHADEFLPPARSVLRVMAGAGLPLLGQTVLLKGVNADAETLEVLFRTMVENRIMPYYLHHPDLAPGTGHFRLSLSEGQSIMTRLRGRVSGVALPTYMLDIPGGFGKVPAGPNYVSCGPTGDQITDIHGNTHSYSSGADHE